MSRTCYSTWCLGCPCCEPPIKLTPSMLKCNEMFESRLAYDGQPAVVVEIGQNIPVAKHLIIKLKYTFTKMVAHEVTIPKSTESLKIIGDLIDFGNIVFPDSLVSLEILASRIKSLTLPPNLRRLVIHSRMEDCPVIPNSVNCEFYQ